MSYPLEVVAEKGTLQRRLGLDPIDRTATHNFPKGKVTVRTHKLPTPNDGGGYALYYTNAKGYRAMCHVGPVYDWSNGYANRTPSSEIYYNFNTGCVMSSELDAFIETMKAIEAKVDALMRKESNGYQDEIS